MTRTINNGQMNIKFIFSPFVTCITIVLSVTMFVFCTNKPTEAADDLGRVSADSLQAAAYADSAQFHLYQSWKWIKAEEFFEKAITLDRGLARAHSHYGWLKTLRRDFEGALASAQAAREAEPTNPLWHAWVGEIKLVGGDYEGALEDARTSLEILPDFVVGNYVLGRTHALLGNFEEAIAYQEVAARDSLFIFGLGMTYAMAGMDDEALALAIELEETGNPLMSWGIAEIYSNLGQQEKAIKWIRKTYQARHPYTPWIGINPSFEPYHEDPAVREILDQLNLPDPIN